MMYSSLRVLVNIVVSWVIVSFCELKLLQVCVFVFCLLIIIIIILQLVIGSYNIKINILGAIRRYTQFQNHGCALEQCLHFAFLAIAMSLHLKEIYEVLCYLSLLIEKLLGRICTVRRIFVYFFSFLKQSHMEKSISSSVLWLLPPSAW